MQGIKACLVARIHIHISRSQELRSVNMKLILSMFVAAVLLSDVEAGRSLVFPEETANSFVELTPAKELSLNAFTLCLRFATELKGKREVILFAYRTRDFDELNVWREKDGRLSLYLSGPGALFEVPELGPLANHVCLTWESLTGRTTMYVNGRSSASQIFQRGHRVRPGGKIILGQDPDNFLGDFQAKQSFVGEIFGVNMWDYVLPSVAIQLLSTGEDFSDANVLDWATVTLMPAGSAVEYNKSSLDTSPNPQTLDQGSATFSTGSASLTFSR